MRTDRRYKIRSVFRVRQKVYGKTVAVAVFCGGRGFVLIRFYDAQDTRFKGVYADSFRCGQLWL